MSYQPPEDYRTVPYTALRAGDPVIYLNHADRWIEAGTVVSGVVRWACPGSKRASLSVLTDFGRGPVTLDLDVTKLKLDPNAQLDGFIRSVYR